jgi:hypothetical protein
VVIFVVTLSVSTNNQSNNTLLPSYARLITHYKEVYSHKLTRVTKENTDHKSWLKSIRIECVCVNIFQIPKFSMFLNKKFHKCDKTKRYTVNRLVQEPDLQRLILWERGRESGSWWKMCESNIEIETFRE